MADGTLFGWVHLSDIHFGHGDTSNKWDQQLVLRTLQRDIASRPAERAIDAVLVTGDIAFSGGGISPDEYKKADAWLREVAKAAGVGVDRVFLVPGNHDVNRGVDKDRNIGRLVGSLRPEPPAKGSSIDDALKDAGDREMLGKRMQGYLDFAAAFGPWAGTNPLPPPVERLYWVRTIDARGGLRVRLIGLNTALLSKNGDKGKLQLGREQLVRALEPPADPNELLVVLTHHPLRSDWLADQGYADGWIKNHAHVHLSGHVHEADSEGARSGAGGEFVRVVSGAAHGEPMPEAWIPANHGYSFGEVRREAGKAVLRVYPRLWSEPNKKFVRDVHRVREDMAYAEHQLRVELPAQPEPPRRPEPPATSDEVMHLMATSVPLAAPPALPDAPSGVAVPAAVAPRPSPIPATGPVRVYISHAPADAAHCDELTKHLAIHRRRGFIESWTSRSVDVGGDWRGAVDQKLREAHVIILLLSTDFLASDYCFDVEMKIARERWEAGELLVFPVLLRPSDLDVAASDPMWFEKLKPSPASPDPKHPVYASQMPVAVWPRQDDAWAQVVKELRELVENKRREMKR